MCSYACRAAAASALAIDLSLVLLRKREDCEKLIQNTAVLLSKLLSG